MAKCKNGSCSRAPAPMAPVGIDPQQAQLQGVQFGQQGAPKGSWWSGTPGYNQMFPTVTPQQSQLIGQAGSAAGNLINRGFSPDYSGFDPIAQQALTQFNEDTIPSLAERFTSMGSGAQNSSAFASQLGAHAADLQQGLAALRSQYGQQQQGMNQNLLNILLNGGMQSQFHNHYTEPVGGFKQGIGRGIGGALPLAAAAGLTALTGGAAAPFLIPAGLSALQAARG